MSEVWNAIMVRDIIYGMAEFAARKCEGWDDNEDWDYTTENPEITDAEMEQIVPGITQQVTETVPDTSRPTRCTSPSTPMPENSPRPPSTKWTRKTK